MENKIKNLIRFLNNPDWIVSVGISVIDDRDYIYVYVKDIKFKEVVPEVWEDVNVKVVKVSEFKPC